MSELKIKQVDLGAAPTAARPDPFDAMAIPKPAAFDLDQFASDGPTTVSYTHLTLPTKA